MLINWFTVGAQFINFLVLVGLLKHFLYKLVLNAIDTREKRIKAELADADAKKAEAMKERDEFQTKSKTFDEQRSALLAVAVADAGAEKARLLDEMRSDAEALKAKQHAALQNEKTALGGAICRLATTEVFAIARKALSDLATVSLEERMGEVFTRRLRETDTKSKEALAIALRDTSQHAVIRSTFDLGNVQRAAIQNALNEDFSTEVHTRFETTPSGVCGIELTVGGQRVSWNIAEYLESLERKVGEFVDGHATVEEFPTKLGLREAAPAISAA